MDVRKAYLEFFEKRGHKVVPSSPLVPDDATLLFTNAGMVQFKNIFTGEVPAPTPPRATSSQTCIRAGGKHNDLENVGYTNRHHTFFEMLGNFSFGDYFKEDAIAYAWEFVAEVLKFPKEKLWVTVHESDDEAEAIWKRFVSPDRIMRFGDKDNFWQMGDTGPCGPCSEIFYDQGAEHFNSEEDVMGGDGDRFLEIWNLVFMQYERDASGTLTPLPKPSIDTGMGLERVTALLEGKSSNYDSSLFMPLIDEVAKLSGKTYIYAEGASFRVIADHIRSVTFLLSQGVNFSNEGRGYVLRRILRRAIRHGYLLGIKEPFMYKLVDTLGEMMGDHYPYIVEKAPQTKEAIRLEEERFLRTLSEGIEIFNQELQKSTDLFSGDVAFKLYDTHGFPLDLTQDMLKDRGLEVDLERFDTLMQEQRAKAKAAWKGSGDEAVSGDFKALLEKHGENHFTGYDETKRTSKILALLDSSFKEVETLEGEGWVMLDKTPLYAESGGQVGDRGRIGSAEVLDTKKFFGLNLSKVKSEKPLKIGDEVEVEVDMSRLEIRRHHSATHLLHKALREILGDHISQAGSLNDDKRLRFDFTHPKPLSADELEQVEAWVQERIARGGRAQTDVMSIDEAKESGAMALFGEKYGDSVRVVTIAESKELCGGTHVEDASEIGAFFITKESGVSAGVRRIEAVCSLSAVAYAKEMRQKLAQISQEVKNSDPILGVNRLKKEISSLKSEIQSLNSQSKKSLTFESIGGVDVAVEIVESGDIKSMIDDLKNQKDRVAVMLLQPKGEKVLIVAGVKNAPAKAGAWIKKIAPIVGGGGGGRDDFAQAGGKDVSQIEKAKSQALLWIKKELGA